MQAAKLRLVAVAPYSLARRNADRIQYLLGRSMVSMHRVPCLGKAHSAGCRLLLAGQSVTGSGALRRPIRGVIASAAAQEPLPFKVGNL